MITYVTAAAHPAPAKRKRGANAGLAFIKVTNAMLVMINKSKEEREGWLRSDYVFGAFLL